MKTEIRLTCMLLIASGATLWTARAEPQVASGITESINDVMLSASVPGIVSAWKFKEGDFVEEGQVIIELDTNLEELELTRRDLVMRKRKADWEALKALSEKNSISVKKDDLEKAETDYKVAAVERDVAAEELRRRRIAAPCAGYIVEITRDVGEACQPYQPLIRLADTRQCYFVSHIEAKAAAHLKGKQKVRLEIERAAGSVTLEGEVTFFSPVIDPASGLQKIKVLFDNSDGRIRPGTAGKMYFE
jgi:RND family efflux transporter MFP subunit